LIKDIVVTLIKKYNTNCPFTIARELGIIILYEHLDDIMGYFSQNFKIKFIHLNQDLNENELWFTCAHELGHAIMHPNINTPFLKRNTLFSIDKFERQANTFAVELRLTDKLLQKYPEYSLYNLAEKIGIPRKLADLKTFNRSLK